MRSACASAAIANSTPNFESYTSVTHTHSTGVRLRKTGGRHQHREHRRHGDSIMTTEGQDAKHDRLLDQSCESGSLFPSRGINCWRQMRVAQKPRWTGEYSERSPPSQPSSQEQALLSARCPGYPPRMERQIRGRQKALIRQFLREFYGVPAPRRHMHLFTHREGSTSYLCDAGCSSQRTNRGNMGPLRIFRV